MRTNFSAHDQATIDRIIKDLRDRDIDITNESVRKHPLFLTIDPASSRNMQMSGIKIKQSERDKTKFSVVIEGTGIDLSNSLHSKIIGEALMEVTKLFITAVKITNKPDPLSPEKILADLIANFMKS